MKIIDANSMIATKTSLGWVIHRRYEKERNRDFSACIHENINTVNTSRTRAESLDIE